MILAPSSPFMQIIEGQNGIVHRFSKAEDMDIAGLVYVEGTCQVYGPSVAEHVRVGGILATKSMSLKACPVRPQDVVVLKDDTYLVSIDTKKLAITAHDPHAIRVKQRLNLSGVSKIVLSDLLGNLDLFNGRLLLMVIKEAEKTGPFEKFQYKDAIGEGHPDIVDLALCVVDLDTGKTDLVALPEHLLPIKARMLADGSIVFLAVDRRSPRNTGLIYCSNKPVGLYRMMKGGGGSGGEGGGGEGEGEEKVTLICTDHSCRSIVLSKDRRQFVYLRSELGGAHFKSSQLVCVSQEGIQKTLHDDLMVGSVFGMNLPEQSFTDWIYMTLQAGFYSKVARIHHRSGELQVLSGDQESWSIVSCVDADFVVCQSSSVLSPPVLGVLKDGVLVKAAAGERLPGAIKHIHIHKHCEALLVTPGDTAANNREVILMPHGGPNSNYVNEYHPFLATLLQAGYSLCRINFTGSTGYGAESIDRLIRDGQVGLMDVEDCMAVHAAVCGSFRHVHLFGGSHGGLLVAHMSSRHPKLFKTCIMLNPVITMYANCVASDIFDYVYQNLGIEYKDCRPPTKDDLALMLDRSPRPTADNPPTLVLVGEDDLRVPAFNGVSWFGWLRALGVKTQCLAFPKCNHNLGAAPETDAVVQQAVLEFLKQ